MEMINAIGRRKSSVARVYLTEGTGKITINKKDLKDFFPSAILQYVVKQPLNLLEVAEKYDIKANLDGGGFTGQSQALRLAIARALVKVNAEDKKALKDQGSSHATLVLLSVRSQVSPRLVVASSSVSVNILNRLASKPIRLASAGDYLWVGSKQNRIKKESKQLKKKKQCQELILTSYSRQVATLATSVASGIPLWLLTSSWSAMASIS